MNLPIQLPNGFISHVHIGDIVSVGDVLATGEDQQEVVVNIKEREFLKKNPGDHVQKGAILASKKGLFGLSKTEIVSNVEGVITRFERHTGNLVIRTTASKRTIFSPVAGTISLCDNEKIVIETEQYVLQGGLGIGETATGEVMILEESFTEENQGNLLYYLDGSTTGKVVVGNFFTREMLLKGIGLDVGGFIGVQIAENDLSYLSSRGHKKPVITLDLEGVSKLKRWNGKQVFLDGNSKSIVLL